MFLQGAMQRRSVGELLWNQWEKFHISTLSLSFVEILKQILEATAIWIKFISYRKYFFQALLGQYVID